jgi:hypothetical protein
MSYCVHEIISTEIGINEFILLIDNVTVIRFVQCPSHIFLNLSSCSEHFIRIKHRIFATLNINKGIQF